MKIFQKGFNYSQDGAGNRLVYHLQGCNMKCPWCANPEGMKMDGVLVADEEWLLESICPKGAIQGTQVERSICAACGDRECITKHNTKGMYLSYTEQSVEEIVQEVLDNEMMFYDGGGVTFTGGEATMQYEELKSLLIALKKHDIHIAIETNGSHPHLQELFPYIDQLIMDCKIMDAENHRKYIGVSNETVLQNITAAAVAHSCLHVRVPLIGGVNDEAEERAAFLAFFDGIKGPHVTFEVLSYHEFGKKKWKECGWDYTMDGNAYVKEETLQKFKKDIAALGAKYERT
ncbi:MAG: glycyl-radical enzyme activating protein [Lachnospiraceae bacterium]|nr:glycyl-radical enzyme activating protein [Lachnospiraceae bacterium]